jgi:hypothetical protein
LMARIVYCMGKEVVWKSGEVGLGLIKSCRDRQPESIPQNFGRVVLIIMPVSAIILCCGNKGDRDATNINPGSTNALLFSGWSLFQTDPV